MGKRPVIGIMPGYDMDKGRLYTAADYVDGITRGGGLPCILPLDIEPGMAEQIIDTFDGFLFTGGPDVDARAYGEENRKCQGGISPLRDKLEQELARLALNAKKTRTWHMQRHPAAECGYGRNFAPGYLFWP